MATTTAPATTTAAASAQTTVAVPDPQPALTSALSRLRVGADGTQQLSVQLHPAELGAVNVTATISGGTLNVTVACADQAARAAVTAALPTLHHQLSTAGFTGVDVSFGSQSQNAQQQTGNRHSGDGQPTGTTGTGTDGATATRPATQPTPRRSAGAGTANLDRWL